MRKDCSSNRQFLFTEFKMIITAHVSIEKEIVIEMCRSFCLGACRPGPSKNNYWGKRQMIILEKTIPLINPYMYRGLFCSVQRTGNLSAETKIPQFGLSQITDYYNKGEGTCRVRNLFIILLPCQFCEFFMKTMRNSSCVSCCHTTTKKSLP